MPVYLYLKLSLLDMNHNVCLLDEPHVLRFELHIWIYQGEIVVANNLRDELVHLQEGNVLPEASSGSQAKLEE